MLLRPGNDTADVKSYRRISLLLILPKVFGKLLLKRLKSLLKQQKLTLNHQFDFRNKHMTIELTLLEGTFK